MDKLIILSVKNKKGIREIFTTARATRKQNPLAKLIGHNRVINYRAHLHCVIFTSFRTLYLKAMSGQLYFLKSSHSSLEKFSGCRRVEKSGRKSHLRVGDAERVNLYSNSRP